MKECPKCGNTYPESFLFCPEDGSSLIEGKEQENAKRIEALLRSKSRP